MASKVLPQALIAIPTNHSTQCPPLKKQQLGFTINSFRRFSLSDSRGSNPMMVSRASSNLFGSKFSSLFDSPARSSVDVRSEAEGSSDVPAEGESEAAAVVEEELPENSEAEPEAEAETAEG